ncbi:MAG: glycosyltransferase [Barnesiella sp.]|nr:glycosyltransferase [Barnesiella sp.]
MSQVKVSVIVPIYNVEEYIEKCVRTLFEQTLDDMEYIFVDDCSPDGSMAVVEKVLADYPHRRHQAKIIRHDENKGVSRSRQDGFDASTGEYVIHCDPDDWVERDMYELMYSKAMADDADIVGCNYVLEYPEKSVAVSQDFSHKGEDAVIAILSGKLHSGLWERMIRRRFITEQNVTFADEITFMEDMLYVMPLHDAAAKVSYVDKALYHYRMRGDSAINMYTKAKYDSVIKVFDQLKDYCRSEACEQQRLKTVASQTLGLITRPETYDPVLWRKATYGVPMEYFGSARHQLSPFLVRNGLDLLNLWVIKLYRKL